MIENRTDLVNLGFFFLFLLLLLVLDVERLYLESGVVLLVLPVVIPLLDSHYANEDIFINKREMRKRRHTGWNVYYRKSVLHLLK